MKSILITSSNHAGSEAIRNCLKEEYIADAAPNIEECLEKFKKKRYEFVFVDLALLGGPDWENGHTDYKKVLQPFWNISSSAQLIVLTPQEKIRDAVEAVKAGASNYLTFPINPDEVKYVTESLESSIRMQSELDYLRDKFWQSDALDLVRTNSPIMIKVFDKVKSVAGTKTTVLLTGETGTGKGVIARIIHRHSRRAASQFISVHCGAMPDTLLESELFGHEKGAFTGAVRRKLGRFEIAHGGTIFLDEIATISASAQIKLLEVLQDKTFQRVGGEENIQTDVRILAASNINPMKMVENGSFRNDLYYRLSVFPIEIPPLRDRLEDIPILVDSFLKDLNKFHSRDIHDVHPHVMEAFNNYSWPGNIRELENLIERAYILETSSILTPESFPSELFATNATRARISLDTSLTLAEVRARGVENIERHYLKELLALNCGKINITAQAAGISARQLRKLLLKYGIRKEEFKTIPIPGEKTEP